ncbi:MAG: hypothetical protein HW406_481 [Candidatus Brocadiaceae bacterium]|nr:hypothetical protein [Candidatus Brocadiaceae bacterium]
MASCNPCNCIDSCFCFYNVRDEPSRYHYPDRTVCHIDMANFVVKQYDEIQTA